MMIPLTELLPDEWAPAKGVRQVVFHAYRVARADIEQFSKIKPFMVSGVHACFVSASLRYTSAVGQLAFIDDNQRIQTTQGGMISNIVPEGNYVLLFTPVEHEGEKSFDEKARDKIKTAHGLLMAHFGRNIAFDFMFEQSMDLTNTNIHVYMEDLQNPHHYSPPFIDDLGLDAAYNLDQHLADLPQDVRERVRLAMRWFAESTGNLKIDGFLKCWFALETIGMASSNIKHINQTLSRIYDLEYEDVKKTFLVGRIQGLRSQIVHNGYASNIEAKVIIYMQALFEDLFSDTLNLPFRRRAEAVLRFPGFSLDDALPRKR